MRKFSLNKTLLLFLVTAFITVQWTATHIHLAEHHNHDDDQHQHEIQAHAHNTTSHHADPIDSAHTDNTYNVVDLDNDCTSSVWKKLSDQAVASISSTHYLSFIPQTTGTQLLELDRNKRSYITYSTIMLRAPPQFS